MKSIKNIDFLLFDLGNVIINIDYQFTFSELKKLLPENKFHLIQLFFPSNFHKQYEKGLISSKLFRDEVRIHFQEDWDDMQIDHIWNSLLKDIPNERIELVKKLRANFGMAVLSNTNEIHINKVNEILMENFGLSSLDPLFDQVFFSHELQLAKPSKEIYEVVADKLNTDPSRILFFDDLEENLIGARSVGYQTHLINHPKGLISFFDNVL